MALTREELLNYRYSRPALEAEPAPEEKPKGSWFDPIASFGAGAGSLVSGVGTTLFGSDSAIAEAGYSAQDYWGEKKSARLKAEEAALSQKISEGDWSGAGKNVLTSPFLAANMLAGSAPAMAAGMGVGGIVARGMAGAGAMTNAAGQLTRAGGAVASGIGEGAFIATDVYEATKGNLAAAGVAGTLLGVGVSAITPGSIGSAYARKVAGTADEGLTVASQAVTGGMAVLGREGMEYAAGRALRSGAQEFGQEFVQEGGQALIEQAGKGEELNLKSAAAQAVVGGILGAGTGMALHPITGEGSKAAELQDAMRARDAIASIPPSTDGAAENQRLQALRIAGARVDVLESELAVVEKRGAASEGEKLAVDAAHAREEAARNPNDDTAKAKANYLTLSAQTADIPADQRTSLQVETLKVAELELKAALNPDSREAKDQADTAKAALLMANTTPDAIKEGTDKAVRLGVAAILDPKSDLNTTVQDFSRTEEASAIGRSAVGGLNTVVAGVEQGAQQVLSDTYVEEEEAQKREEKAIAEAQKVRAKAQQDAVKQETQAVKLEQAKTKLNAERAKLGLPTINADAVPEATGVPADTQIEGWDAAPASARDGFIAWQVQAGATQQQAEIRADNFTRVDDADLQRTIADTTRSPEVLAYAREIAAQRTPTAPSLDEAREVYRNSLRNISPEMAEEVAAEFATRNPGEWQETVRRQDYFTPEVRAYAQALLDANTTPAPTRRTQTTVAEAERRLRAMLQGDGLRQATIDETVANLRREAATGDIAGIESAARGFEQRNDHRPAEFLRALLDEREAGGTTAANAPAQGQTLNQMFSAQATENQRRLEAAREAAERMGASALAIRSIENLSEGRLNDKMHDIGSDREIRELAFHSAVARGFPTSITYAQFIARENELDAGIQALIDLVPSVTRRAVGTHLTSMTDEALGNLAEGRTNINEHVAEQSRIARTAVAFRNKTYLGDFYPAGSSATATAAPVAGSTQDIQNRRSALIAARTAYIDEYDEARADMMRTRTDEDLRNIARNGGTSRVTRTYAEAILANRGVTPTTAPAAAPAQATQLPRAEIEREYEDALNDWADSMNATLSVARRHVEGLTDERVLEGLNDPDLAPFFLPVAQYRGLDIPDNVLPPANPVTREVENNFEARAMNALRNGVLDKLGEFWTKVMQGRGQRVFNINTSDLAFTFDDYSEITQEALDDLKDRYNDELNRQAQQWAADNNQPLTTLTNPVVSIMQSGDTIYIKVHSLGRQGQNPYAVPANDNNVGLAYIANYDGHMTTTGLSSAKGSSNLAYRLAAEIGRMAGQNVPAASSLLTNNRMRRHMQSIYADSLFGPGHVSPMESDGDESYQGVPQRVWEATNSDAQRIGLNILRAAHQGTENRTHGITPISRFIENLSYNTQGQIVATSDPKHARGWAKGTVVTDDMLTRKLLEVDRDFNFEPGYDRTQYRPGDPRNSGETAAGRSGAGGVGPDTAKLIIMTNTILNRIENDPAATIPGTWLTRAKKIGREMGGWMFSEAEQAGAKGISQEDAVARVVDMVGDNAAQVLLESGMIDFVQSGKDLTGDTFSDANGKVQGATTPDGKIILVLDNLNDQTFDAVLSHEAIHATIKNLLGEDTYNALMSRLDTLLKAGEGSQWVKDANARIPAGTSEQDRLEEIAGYAVELHVRGGTRGNPLVQWAKDFMSALRTAIIENKALPEVLRTWAMKNIQPADLSRMAMHGLKRVAAKTEADLQPDPTKPSINVGLVVGMGETAETLTPEFVKGEIEKLGVKVGRNNVVDASYEHNGETINETTLVVELDRPLKPAEIERLAINTKQQAIPQRVDGVGGLYGPKAAEWGGFSAHEFRELNGRRSDEVNRESQVTYAPVDTKSSAFKKWFGKSVVTNPDGTPRKMYHGTLKSFDIFNTRDSEAGAHFGPIDQAERFTDRDGGNMMPVYLSIKNPLRLIDHGHWDDSGLTGQLKDLGLIDDDGYNFAMSLENKPGPMAAYVQLVLKEAGYDGIVYLNRYESSAFDKQLDEEGMMPDNYAMWSDEEVLAKYPDAQDSYIIFKPSQAKSAISNTGEFSKKEGDIRRSVGRNWDAEIKSIMAKMANPKTTNAQRVKLNDELRMARIFQRADNEVRYEQRTGQKFSVGASYGTPTPGSVSVVGVHFGNTERNVLNSVAYGKGIKGEEAARLQGQDDIRPRTMFYVDEGNGVTKEPGLGNVGKQVKLNNLYDLREDALNLRNADLNKMERAIVAAGFDGYYNPNYRDMGQGTVVMVGKHDIPVEPYVPGEGAAPAPVFTGNAYAEALYKSKLPGGAMLGREWSVALKGTEFDTPAVQAQLEQRAGERVYRDDLPRFNRGLRYSMAEESAAEMDPVAPELPNTLNVLDNARRSGTERTLEKVRGNIQDKHVTLRRLQQLAGIVRDQVKLDTIGALERLGSKIMTQQQRLVDRPLAKIENILTKAGFNAEDARKSLDQLLVARHAAEYNEHTATINPAKYDETGKYLGGHDAKHPGSGVTDAQARDTLRLLLGTPGAKTSALLEAEQVYRDMIHNLQQFAVERGLEKQETIDAWEKKFPFYTPFNRELNLEENTSVGSIQGTAGLSMRSGIARRAMGSGADIASPLASTALWGLKTAQRGENAVVSRTFLEFAKFVTPNYLSADGKLKPMWSVEKIPTSRVIKKVNVYLVPNADGTMSPEFYNREKAQAYADMQQAVWEAANPNEDPDDSGIMVQKPYDTPQERVQILPLPNYLNEPNVMVIPVDGENVIVTFDKNSKDAMAIVDAFKNKAGSGEGVQKLNRMLAIPRMFSRWVMATSTGYNPVFMVFNALRDVQAAAINAGADKIPGWTKGDSAKIASGWMPAMNQINKQLREDFKQLHDSDYTAPAPTPDSMGDWMERMKAAGGATGITHSIVDVESAETQMRRLFGQAVLDQSKPVGSPDDIVSKTNEMVAKVGDVFYRFGQGETKNKYMAGLSKQLPARVARWNEAAELTTRTLVFKRAYELYRADGKDHETAESMAANISKNISTNFNRRGNWTGVINQLFPFFNAAANGTARLAETMFEKGTYTVTKSITDKETGEVREVILTDQKTKLTPYGKKVVGVIGTLGFLQSALLLMAGFDDDDIPEHVKERNFIIPNPFTADKDYVMIPMPHGFNIIVNMGRNLGDAMWNTAHGEFGKAGNNLYNATLGQIGALNPMGNAGNLVTDMLPAIADPFVSIAMNKDAFGRPIAKEDMNPANPTPGFTRAKEGASTTGRILAEGLNTLTGGNEDQKGFISPTPDQIDFVLGIAGGGVGREAMKALTATKAGYDMAVGNEREVMPAHKMPLVGRLYGNASEPAALRQKLFTVRTQVNETYARYEGLKERGLKEEAAAFKAEHPEIALRDDIERFARGNAKQTKARALARDEGEIGKVNEITGKQDSKIATLLEKYEALK